MKQALAVSIFAVIAALLVAPASAADYLDEEQHADSLGDAAYFNVDGGPGDGIPTVVPSRAIGDVRGFRAVHKDHTVHVALQYRSLPDAGIKNKHEFRFKTPQIYRNLTIVATPGNWKGTVFFTDFEGKTRTCSGLEFVIKYSYKRVVLDVPRSCLGNPKFLRVGAQGVFTQTERVWVDDAYSEGAAYSGVVYSPAIHHPISSP